MSFRSPLNPLGGGFSFLPPVIKNLLILNIGIFLLTFMVQGSSLENMIIQLFALWGINSPYGTFLPWQLVTYMFLHGGFMHLFFNMLALWMFGNELENYWGSKRFLTYYFVTGIGAGLIQLTVQFLEGSGVPTVGASGGVFGVLLAFGMMFPDRIIFFNFFIPIKAKYFVMIYGAIELISGFSGMKTGIAHFAHLGGMIFGFILLKYWQSGGDLGLWWKKFIANMNQPSTSNSSSGPKIYDFQKETGQSTKPNSAKTDAQRLDEILDKIAEGGYAVLTKEEKEFLFTYSRKK